MHCGWCSTLLFPTTAYIACRVACRVVSIFHPLRGTIVLRPGDCTYMLGVKRPQSGSLLVWSGGVRTISLAALMRLGACARAALLGPDLKAIASLGDDPPGSCSAYAGGSSIGSGCGSCCCLASAGASATLASGAACGGCGCSLFGGVSLLLTGLFGSCGTCLDARARARGGGVMNPALAEPGDPPLH